MRSFKGLASYKLLESGWVLKVTHVKPADTNITIFRADVVPSFRINDTPHHPWAVARDSGDIIAAHCDCKAGYVLWLCGPIHDEYIPYNDVTIL